MPAVDFVSTRLHVDGPLEAGGRAALSTGQLNYLRNVLRFADGDALLAFDGRSGEWRARFRAEGKRGGALEIEARTRPQPPAGDLELLFAPLKHARLDYLVQKATEMGASRIAPVLTRRTQVARVNLERMRANVVEAAEQCGVLNVPAVAEPVALDAALDGWRQDRRLIFCDEDAPVADPLAALAGLAPSPLAVLIGPEGGFDETERARLRGLPGVVRLALGPRILRADTAAVAALALVQAACGDWRSGA
jgi:16S rRNA (uracil1498-N3)-methyltransferase